MTALPVPPAPAPWAGAALLAAEAKREHVSVCVGEGERRGGRDRHTGASKQSDCPTARCPSPGSPDHSLDSPPLCTHADTLFLPSPYPQRPFDAAAGASTLVSAGVTALGPAAADEELYVHGNT